MRVLLVEDNPIDAQSLMERLEAVEGHRFHVEHVGRLGDISANPDTPPEVVLLDLSLPDGEGTESLRRVRSCLGDVPVVVLTADDDERRSVEMLREGAEDYLVKGKYSDDTLLRTLRHARERHELKQRLARADRLAVVGQLAAGVAHEVSNPAALVLANTAITQDLLATLSKRGGRDTGEGISTEFALAECRRMVDENREALERIRSVVRDLQGYSRLERNEVERVHLNALVERTCNLVRSSLRHRAALDRELQEVPSIAADRAKLEQLLTNLLINAGHAVEANTAIKMRRVVVSTAHEGDWIRLSVEDNGCGMSEDVQKRIFEPFFTTKAADQGTGLGMAITSDIARQHGGRIECDSQVGRGTRFDVWLPVDTGFTLPKPPDPQARASGLRGRVLLIDDEPRVAAVYGDLIGDHHEVVVAGGGREADEILRGDTDFDVILCDLMMPDMDGVAVYETAVEREAGLASRFIFCSGGLVTQRARQFAERIPNPLLYKPASIESLLEAIDRVMQEHAGDDTARSSA